MKTRSRKSVGYWGYPRAWLIKGIKNGRSWWCHCDMYGWGEILAKGVCHV